MQKLSEKQIVGIAGGIGCECKPGVTFVALNMDVCYQTCCINPDKEYCTFENGPTKNKMPPEQYTSYHCFPCGPKNAMPPPAYRVNFMSPRARDIYYRSVTATQ